MEAINKEEDIMKKKKKKAEKEKADTEGNTKSDNTKSAEKWRITPRVILGRIINEFDMALRFYNGGYYFYDRNTMCWDNRGIDCIEDWSQKIVDHIRLGYTEEECGGDITNQFVKEIFGFIKRRYHVSESELDRNLIGVKNGILNTKTRELIDSDPNIFVPVQVNAIFNPEAKAKNIKSFLNDILKDPKSKSEKCDENEILTMEEITGYPMEYGYPIKKAFALFGPTHSGKTTYFNLLKKFYGIDNVSTISLYDFGSRFRPVQMVGKLINNVADLSYGKMDDRTISEFMIYTGNEESVTVEEKNMPVSQYKPISKQYYGTNWAPNVNLNNEPFLNRWIIIPLENQFSTSNIFDTLTTDEEMSGLLNIALDGLERLRKNNQFSKQQDLDDIRALFQRYRLPPENEHSFDYLDERIIPKSRIRCKPDLNVNTYKIVCLKCGKKKELSLSDKQLVELIYKKSHKSDDGKDCEGELFYRKILGIKDDMNEKLSKKRGPYDVRCDDKETIFL